MCGKIDWWEKSDLQCPITQSSYGWSASHPDRDTLQKSYHHPSGSGETRPTDGKHDIIKPKDLCLIPFRVALAAQDQGWWVRSAIIWAKTNPMPESVTDRPTDAYEHIFMLTKSARYYWDQEAVREAQTGNAHSRGTEDCNESYQEARDSYYGFKSPVLQLPSGRNIRNVWTINTQPYPEAHFATFPEALVTPCIKAGTSEKGCCPECGSPMASPGSAELKCPYCKCAIEAGVKFCPECGKKIALQCLKCETKLEPGAKFCPNCGEKITGQ